MRRTVTLALVLIGIASMVFGYTMSAPWGASSVGDSNPSFVGAPALFVLGIMLLLAAAVVYEVLPERDDDRVG